MSLKASWDKEPRVRGPRYGPASREVAAIIARLARLTTGDVVRLDIGDRERYDLRAIAWDTARFACHEGPLQGWREAALADVWAAFWGRATELGLEAPTWIEATYAGEGIRPGFGAARAARAAVVAAIVGDALDPDLADILREPWASISTGQ